MNENIIIPKEIRTMSKLRKYTKSEKLALARERERIDEYFFVNIRKHS